MTIFQFSFRQYLLLGIGMSLILFSIALSWIEPLSEAVFKDDTVAWQQLTISPGKQAYVSSLDDSTLVLRSSSHADARLTLFTREDDGASPGDLVKDLCGRDSCRYVPLADARLNGAIADYASATPLRFVLMHPANAGIWLEYKGPPKGFSAFDKIIDAIVNQLHEPPEPTDAS
ncbi:MAG: hypothetical protein JSU95_05620 [Betaproteobacteria bacterium]|nr:MAG: hypothetical protein JSU95_05620 [Betaproteobacteria bacterium]